MAKRIGAKRRDQLIQDILSAQHDLVALARAYRLSPDDLARWITDAANYRVLRGLCVMADLQTQILLSRYRLLAAGRLIKLATEDDPHDNGDIARKACVDLLRLDLKGAELPGALPQKQQEQEFHQPPGADDLRQMIYGAIGDIAATNSPAAKAVGQQGGRASRAKM